MNHDEAGLHIPLRWWQGEQSVGTTLANDDGAGVCPS